MFIVGVEDYQAPHVSGAVYLWGNESGGWGKNGAGAIHRDEPFGQNRGRWFCSLPFDVSAVKEKPSAQGYNGRTYLCGGYTYNLVLDEHHRIWRQGIRPPEEAPTITGGGAPSTVIAYLSWWDELTFERSPLSKGTVLGTTTPRTWTNLPTRPPDDVYSANDTNSATAGADDVYLNFTGGRIARLRPGDRYHFPTEPDTYAMIHYPGYDGSNTIWLAEKWGNAPGVATSIVVAPVMRATHLELWLSVDGDLARLAMRVAVGTTQVVESKGLVDLGEAFVTQFQRFPRCTMNAIYHDRQVMAGDSENPDTVFLSALFQPERFEGLQFRTRDGLAITGILATRDFCMVFTRHSAYMLQGYSDSDYTLNPVDQSIGAVGHHCNTVIHGNPYVWSEKGPYMYNGGWHPLSPENRWTPPDNGRDMVAADDPYFNTYIVSNAHRASRSLQEPFNTFDQTGTTPNGIENDPGVLDAPKFFAVLDYTLVQPETGGGTVPARLSWDRSDTFVVSFEGEPPPPPVRKADDQLFMKYIRNRYGSGNLYKIGGYRRDEVADPYDDFDWLANTWSFPVCGLVIPGNTISLALRSAESADIVLPFDFLGDGGGFLMEQKQIKRVWYYMRMDDGSVKLYVAPGPGYWGTRMYPATAIPISYDVNFAAGDYRATPEAPHADIIMPPLPDFLSGRGMWLKISGTNLIFMGYAVETIWGAEVSARVPEPR